MTGHTKPLARRVRVAALATLAVGAVATVGSTFGQWSTDGQGNAYAKARRAIPLTTSPATVSESLFPGGTGDAVITIRNANPYPVTATSIVGDGPVRSDVAACDAAGNGVSFSDQTGSWLVPRESSATITLEDAVAMDETSPDACQGATFTVPVAIAGQTGGGGTPPTTSSTTSSSTTSSSTSSSTTSSSTTSSTTTSTTAAAARLVFEPPQHNFGMVPVGQSATFTFTVRNVGNAVSSAGPVITIAGAGGQYSLGSSNCTGQLFPGATCAAAVLYRPTTPGTHNAAVVASVPESSANAPVSGVGGQAQLVLSTSSLAFGNVPVGSAATASITVLNQGNASSGAVGVGIGGANASEFTIIGTSCGGPLAPGQGCGTTIRFAPSSPGSKQAVFTASANPGGSVNATLSGTGQ